MRLKKIKTIEKANKYLIDEFIPRYNKTYTVKARGKGDLHKKLTEKDKRQLNSAFSRQTKRTIQNDFTISFNTQWYQLLKEQSVTIQKKDHVIMEERMGEPIKIRLKGRYLNYKIIPKGIKRVKKNIPWVLAATSVKSPIYSKVGHF